MKGSYSTSDAYSLAALSPDGFAIRSMIKGALCDANVVAAEIDYVNAHGTGTVLNDELEAAVLESEFPHRPFVNSTKALLGHTIGACGAFEAAGKKWPLSVNEGFVGCTGTGARWFEKRDGQPYGLNGLASVAQGYQDIKAIWLENSEIDPLMPPEARSSSGSPLRISIFDLSQAAAERCS